MHPECNLELFGECDYCELQDIIDFSEIWANELSARNHTLEAELSQTQEILDISEGWVKQLSKENDDLEARLQAANREIAALKGEAYPPPPTSPPPPRPSTTHHAAEDSTSQDEPAAGSKRKRTPPCSGEEPPPKRFSGSRDTTTPPPIPASKFGPSHFFQKSFEERKEDERREREREEEARAWRECGFSDDQSSPPPSPPPRHSSSAPTPPPIFKRPGATAVPSTLARFTSQCQIWHGVAMTIFRDRAKMTAFPAPPAFPFGGSVAEGLKCTKKYCEIEPLSVAPACGCSIAKCFEILGVDLKQQRNEFHPDKFAIVREENRASVQRMAGEVSTVVNDMYSKQLGQR